MRNDGTDPVPDSTPDLQNVRTDGGAYGDDGIPVLQSLTFSHYGRPGTDLYSRVSVGYLERMFGGVSAEVLWKPVESSFGIGAELNYVAQRDTDMWFGFDEYDYQVATGHLSAYYDFGNGFHGQVDAGRYLAGDWGAGISLDREFANGWRLGAFATLTDISAEDFGEGSFDKGIRLSIPTDYLVGTPTRARVSTGIRSLSRDGGARLRVPDRLYPGISDGQYHDLVDTSGRFWR